MSAATQPQSANATFQPPESQTSLVERRPTLSSQLWGLDWSKELPWQFASGVRVEASTWAEATPFLKGHYTRIFGASMEGRFLVEAMTEAKQRFCALLDVFLLFHGEDTVGVFAAHPLDWSTWYVRLLALVPEYRDKGVGGDLTKQFEKVLPKYGVTRWEADCSAANQRMVRLFTTAGMVQTAMLNSERFGQSMRFTKFLAQDANEIYGRQFLIRPV